MRHTILLAAFAALGPASIAQEPLDVWHAPAGSVGFGTAVSGLGDVDGDGTNDAAVADRAGSVYVISGASGAIVRTLDFGTHFIGGVSSIDTDADGIHEVVISHQNSLVNASVWVEAFDVSSGALRWSHYDFQFGGEAEVRFVRIDDYDGDGNDDLLVGMPDQDLWHPAWWESSAKVLSGATGQQIAEWTHNPEGMGEGVASIGDVDGDGRVDVALGSRSQPGASGGIVQRGRVQVIGRQPGSNVSATIWAVTGSHAAAEFGEDLVGLGDVNGDGLNDLAALETRPTAATPPAPGTPSMLRVQVLSGADGTFLYHRDFPGEAFPGIENEVELEPLGDVDGDGNRDFAMVVPVSGVHGQPEVRVLSGATLESLHVWSVDLAPTPGAGGASAGAELGDLDGDGSPELLIGRADDGAGRVLIVPTRSSIGANGCTGAVNSTGRAAGLRIVGSSSVVANEFDLIGTELPASVWVLPIAGTESAHVPMVAGSAGTLCVGGAVERIGPGVRRADDGGAFYSRIDLVSGLAVLAGDTRHFQLWFRDSSPAGAATSNLSGSVEVTFQ